MAWCEDNGVDSCSGLPATRAWSSARHRARLAERDAERDAAGRPRRFADFRWTTRESWSRRRRVVGKAEWMPGRGAKGANPALRRHLAQGRPRPMPPRSTRGSIARAARWRTASRSGNSTSSPTAPPPPPCAPTSCGCGSPPSPMNRPPNRRSSVKKTVTGAGP